jgi:hypothetical protein
MKQRIYKINETPNVAIQRGSCERLHVLGTTITRFPCSIPETDVNSPIQLHKHNASPGRCSDSVLDSSGPSSSPTDAICANSRRAYWGAFGQWRQPAPR